MEGGEEEKQTNKDWFHSVLISLFLCTLLPLSSKDPWFNADNKEGVLPLNKQESVGEMEGGGGEGGGGGGEGGGGGGKEEMEIREFNSLSFIQPTEEEPDDQEVFFFPLPSFLPSSFLQTLYNYSYPWLEQQLQMHLN